MNLGFLNDERVLQRAVPPLAKKFGIQPERAWTLLKNQKDGLLALISMRRTSEIRRNVNLWWGKYRRGFFDIGMANLSSVEAKHLPDSTYDQVICLMWLTSALKLESTLQQEIKKVKIVEVSPPITAVISKRSLLQRFISWIKIFFERRLTDESTRTNS